MPQVDDCAECRWITEDHMWNLDKQSIDALLWREGMGLMNWTDRGQLKNYRDVYPDYFKTEAQIDRAIERDAFPNK
jgi:hypothetical protein